MSVLESSADSVFIAIIGVIAIIAVIDDWICLTVVPDDNLGEEPFEDPCYEPSGTHTPPTPDVSPSHAPPPHAPSLRQHVFFISTWVVMSCELLDNIHHSYASRIFSLV